MRLIMRMENLDCAHCAQKMEDKIAKLEGVESVSISARLAWVEVEAPEGLDLNLDGEPMQSDRLRFTVRPQAVAVHLPLDSPLLGAAPAQP